MESESIDKKCSLCGYEASGKIVKNDRSLEFCHECAQDLLWTLTHDDYSFEKEE